MTAAASNELDELMALRARCRAWLNGHRPRHSLKQVLAELAGAPEAALPLDLYGEGEVVARLERETQGLLGMPAASFFHKGVAAQLAALRAWCGERAGARVALHRLSHIELDEQQAYEHLLGLRGQRLGDGDQPFGVEALAALPEPPAVVVVELPLRRGGYRLPAWDELTAISRWCRQHGVPLHLDGARLWESAPHYGRPLHEIAALADSVYVSFYKGLGGLGGCVLAGPSAFIEQTAVWKTRLAGNLYTVFPYALSALQGLRLHGPRMAEYRDRARRLAARLALVPGLRVCPQPPQVNAFQLHLPGCPSAVSEALREVARNERFWLGWRGAASPWPGCTMIEISIGDASEDWADDEAAQLLGAVAACASSSTTTN